MKTMQGHEDVRATPSVLVIGVGNDLRSDDRVGRVIARLLEEKKLSGVTIEEASGEGATLMELWEKWERVILVDAVSSGGEPGTIYRFEAHHHPMPSKFFNYSTHAFSLAEAIEMARSLGILPDRVVVFGIEGEKFEHGTSLSEPVQEATEKVAAQVMDEVMNFQNVQQPTGGVHHA